MKIILFLSFIWMSLLSLYSQNFSISGKFIPNLYSTIEVCDITEDSITFDYIDKLEDKSVNFKKIHKDGMLFFEMDENFPKEFNEDYYYHGKNISTSNNMLILAGQQKNHKTYRNGNYETYDFTLLIAATEGFDTPYSFIKPGTGYFETYRTKYYDCSSFLIEKSTKYEVDNLHKLGLDTPWVENAEGSGIGEGFSIKNAELCPYILIMNGYISYKKPYLYKRNNRVKKLKITGLKSRKTKTLDVYDTPHPQTIDISFITENEDLRIEIADVYKGTKYDDTCIHYLIAYEDEVLPYESTIPD